MKSEAGKGAGFILELPLHFVRFYEEGNVLLTC